MPVLKSWKITNYAPEWIAHGIVSGHPRLPDGMSIHTSPIQKAWIDGETLMLETRSANIYRLDGEEISPSSAAFEETQAALEAYGLDMSFWEQYTLRRTEHEDLRMARMRQQLKPGELWLEVTGTETLFACFCGPDKTIVPLDISIHLGMFQDSILITDPKTHLVDFRYFPKPNALLQPYHESDGLTTILLHNTGAREVWFGSGTKEHTVLCSPGELTVLPVDEHRAEGLLSPDTVNGKSLLSRPEPDSMEPESMEPEPTEPEPMEPEPTEPEPMEPEPTEPEPTEPEPTEPEPMEPEPTEPGSMEPDPTEPNPDEGGHS